MAEDRRKIKVKLCGTPGVFAGDEKERLHFPTRRAEGIFYYLCVKKSTMRDELTDVFWDDCDEQTGRKNLRQALYEIRKVLPSGPLRAEGQNSIYLDSDIVEVEEDSVSGEDLLLSGGEFLQYFYVKGAPGFEEWVEEQRDMYRQRCRAAAMSAISASVRASDIRRLHEAVSAWRRLEPYEEDVVREAMEAYSACGRYNLALQTYHDYQELIRRELEEEPGEELAELYQQIFRLKENDTGQGGGSAARFYCRYREIHALNRHLSRFALGSSRGSLVITGESGVGKSALIHHAARMNPGKKTLIFLTHCYETERAYYLKAFREWFKWLEKYADEGQLVLSGENQAFLHRLFSDRYLTAEDPGQSLFDASGYPVWEDRVLSVFREITERSRMVLFIDDMQWMDDLSRQLLLRLMLEMEDRFCFVGTYRSGEEGPNLDFLRSMERRGTVQFMKLSPFTEEETAEIVREEIPSGEAAALAPRIYQRTEGNAIFLMDLLTMIREEGWDSASIPPRSEYVIQARMRNLTPVQRQILNALSIYMEHAELYELETLVDIDRLALCEELESLQRRRIVRELVVGEYIAYEFSHQYYKEYIYNVQPLAKRRHMHHMVAEAYEKLKNHKRWLEHLPFLIYQYERAGELEKAEMYRAEYSRLAGN